MALQVGSWKNIKLVCGNHGENYEHEMEIKVITNAKGDRDSAFYTCPLFISLDDMSKGDTSCRNRLSYGDFEKMLATLNDLADDGAEVTNLTGYTWTTKNGITFKVIKHSTKYGKFTVSVLNRKANA